MFFAPHTRRTVGEVFAPPQTPQKQRIPAEKNNPINKEKPKYNW